MQRNVKGTKKNEGRRFVSNTKEYKLNRVETKKFLITTFFLNSFFFLHIDPKRLIYSFLSIISKKRKKKSTPKNIQFPRTILSYKILTIKKKKIKRSVKKYPDVGKSRNLTIDRDNIERGHCNPLNRGEGLPPPSDSIKRRGEPGARD